MWCRSCGQDVPGLASAEDGKHRCPRCSEVLDGAAPSVAALAVGGDSSRRSQTQGSENRRLESPPTSSAPLPLGYDGWEIDEELRHIERLLATNKYSQACRPTSIAGSRQFRVDAAHDLPERRTRRPVTTPPSARGDWPILTWTLLSVGVTVVVCGTVLLGWSVTSGRQDLWATGMPITLAGLGGLLLGLIMQFDRLWHDNRQAAAKLDQLDVRLNDLRAATALLSANRATPATAFYAHGADAPHPQSLLSDLKAQLDRLAAKLEHAGE